jgi:hypothetical protein
VLREIAAPQAALKKPDRTSLLGKPPAIAGKVAHEAVDSWTWHMHFTTIPVSVHTGCSDVNGIQLFADGALLAVFVRLDEQFHERCRGRWFLEAAFGVASGVQTEPFEYFADAIAWCARQLGCAALSDEELDNLELDAEQAVAGIGAS